MESTGESNKIQVSEATAHLIRNEGKGYVSVKLQLNELLLSKVSYVLDFFFRMRLLYRYIQSHWLRARTEKVMPKGKGMMQTYWCDPTRK
jgi:hypothetical protein